jgi:hypothetical protein
MFIGVSEECAASIFRVEDGDGIFLRKSVNIYQTTRHHISDDSNPNIHQLEDFK